jgi:hypothetical protein
MRQGSAVAVLLVGASLALFASLAFAQAVSPSERTDRPASVVADARIGDRDRERARLACRHEARRQNFAIRGVTPPREVDDGRLRLRMDLARGDRRWLGTCTYDAERRAAELEARRVESERSGGRPGRTASSASAGRVRDACIREVTQNARTQLVAAGRVERRSGGASVMPMTINVEGTERRVRCFYDDATGAVTIR